MWITVKSLERTPGPDERFQTFEEVSQRLEKYQPCKNYSKEHKMRQQFPIILWGPQNIAIKIQQE